MTFNWRREFAHGCPVDVARVGGFEVTLTEGGAMTIGATVYVGTVGGRVCCVSASRGTAEVAIARALQVAVLRVAKELEGWAVG